MVCHTLLAPVYFSAVSVQLGASKRDTHAIETPILAAADTTLIPCVVAVVDTLAIRFAIVFVVSIACPTPDTVPHITHNPHFAYDQTSEIIPS